MIFLYLFSVVIVILVVISNIRYYSAEKIDCPTCGKTFRLVGGSAKCPKCRSRVTETADGKIIAHN